MERINNILTRTFDELSDSTRLGGPAQRDSQLPVQATGYYDTPARFDLGWVEDDFDEPRPTRSPAVNDIFAFNPPAEDEDIAKTIRMLTGAFPNLSSDFWALLTNRFAELRFSKERLRYILHVALDTDRLINQYRYGRLTVADFTSITRPMTLYSFVEAEQRPGEMAYVYSHLDKPNLCDITTIEEAKLSGLHWIPFWR